VIDEKLLQDPERSPSFEGVDETDPIEEMMGLVAAARLSHRHTDAGDGLGDLVLTFVRHCFTDYIAQLTPDQKQAADDIQDRLNDALIVPSVAKPPPPGDHVPLTNARAVAQEKSRRRAVDAGEVPERPPAW
jgi:hypothetical protein